MYFKKIKAIYVKLTAKFYTTPPKIICKALPLRNKTRMPTHPRLFNTILEVPTSEVRQEK